MTMEKEEGMADSKEKLFHNSIHYSRMETILILCSFVVAIALASAYGLCAQDDAFISLRYAQNFWEGHGLVFNPSERVEGITNLLWTMLFVPIFALGWDPVFSFVFLGLGSLLFLFWGVYRLSLELDVSPVWGCWLLALDASILLESMEGLESVFFSALLCWGIVWGIRAKRAFSWQSILMFVLALCTRPEAPLVFALFHLLVWWKERNHRVFFLNVVMFGVALGALTCWRLWYYGDYVPNTFHAKVGGIALWRGLLYLKFYAQYHILLCLGLLWGWKKPQFRMLLIIYVVYLLYVCMVGGDFKFTSRFLLPLVSIVILMSAHLLSHVSGWKKILLIALWILPQARLYQRSLDWAADRRKDLIARRVAGLWVRANTPFYAKLAIHSVGVIPFYAQRHTIDMWGLNDRVIAKTPMKDFGAGIAGHERTNPEYVFAQRPDIYMPEDQLFVPTKVLHKPPKEFPSYFEDEYKSISIQIEASYLNIWVRKDLIPDKQKSKEDEP